MNELKRRLVFDKPEDESMKKYAKESITCLEHVSNEIFYDLFEYFNGYEIIQTFSNLNIRFEQLLYSSSILIKTHFYLFNLEKLLFTNNEILSTKLCPTSNLKILSIYCSNNLEFLNAHRWEQLILNYYPQLEKFYLTYSHCKTNSDRYSIYFGLNQFSSLFWIQRKWLFEIIIDNKNINYIIHPYRKTWHDILEDENIEYSLSTSLILMNSHRLYNDMIKHDLNRVLFTINIYHLNIFMEHLPFTLLLEILSLLPDLLSLKIHSFQLDGNNMGLIIKQIRNFHDNIYKCQIKSICIEEIDVDNVHFLFRSCRFIKNLEIKYMINMNIEDLPRFLDLIQSWTSTFHSFTLHVPIINDEFIRKFDYIIHSEKLLVNYTIKRLCNKINIQWK